MILGYTLLEWAQIIGALSTVFLIYLYWRMSRIQNRQTEIQEQQSDIMDRQTDLMATEYKPDVRIHSDDVSVSENMVTIPLSNVGNGMAKNLQLRNRVRIRSDASLDVVFEDSRDPLTREHVEHDTQDPPPDDTILAEEQNISFQTEVSIQTILDREDNMRITAQLPIIANRIEDRNEIEGFSIEFFLEYDDITGETDEKRIRPLDTSMTLEEGMTLEEFVDQGYSARITEVTVGGPPTKWERVRERIPWV